jgi:N-methylhydantoinase A/oxoprolinase/acetone carboxylase beta subunit
VACADIGGTSFDVALLTNGEYEIKSDPDVAHLKMNFPMVKIDSIGAGTGSFVRVNPISKRIEFGPDSAGSGIGMSNPAVGLDTVTISDCDVVLGLINVDYFLGGQVTLDRARAIEGVRTQIAEPLGLDVAEAATGVIELFEDELQRQLRALVTGKGFEAAEFVLLGYGGGGPLHVAGFSAGLGFKDVLVPTWAAGFSAFGCVCADFAYRLDRQVDIEIPPNATAEDKARVARHIDRAWTELRARVAAEFAKSGIAADRIEFHPQLRLQYLGQLNDIEVLCPLDRLTDADDVDRILAEYEEQYGKVYAASARAPELGYFVTLAIVTGTVPAEKPVIAAEPLAGPEPPAGARKERRPVFSRGRWADAEIYEMDRLLAGNELEGLAIVEAPSTTFVIPEGWQTRLDEHRIFHLSEGRG